MSRRSEWPSPEESLARIAYALEEIVAFMQTIARDADRSAGAQEGLLDRTVAHYDRLDEDDEEEL